LGNIILWTLLYICIGDNLPIQKKGESPSMPPAEMGTAHVERSMIDLDRFYNAALALSQGKKVVLGAMPQGFTPADILLGIGMFLEAEFAPAQGRWKRWVTYQQHRWVFQARLVPAD
jgi:hypothetical protein